MLSPFRHEALEPAMPSPFRREALEPAMLIPFRREALEAAMLSPFRHEALALELCRDAPFDTVCCAVVLLPSVSNEETEARPSAR